MTDYPDQSVTIRIILPARDRQHALAKVNAYLSPGFPFGLRWAPLDKTLQLVLDLAEQTENRAAAEQTALDILRGESA
jgi:hypothetical protein